MSNHVFHEIYLHINWHTKRDQPQILPRLEPMLYKMIKQRCIETKGVYFHEVGGTETHIHVGINIEPMVNISEFIGELKGFVSHEINALEGGKVLEWQRGFGVVSFSKRQLKWVCDYIRNQKEHHAQGTLSEKLERYDSEEDA